MYTPSMLETVRVSIGLGPDDAERFVKGTVVDVGKDFVRVSVRYTDSDPWGMPHSLTVGYDRVSPIGAP